MKEMLILLIEVKIIQFLKGIKCIPDITYNSEIKLSIQKAKKVRKFIPYKI